MQTHTSAKESASHASKPFFGSQAARATLFFGSSPAIQTKLTVGESGDRFEQEADAMADRVVQRVPSGKVQAKCSQCRDEDALQAKADAATEAPENVEQSLQGGDAGGQALPPQLRDEMEAVFETDFSAVRIHTGTSAESLNQDLNARAFTHGSDVYFNSGEFRPETSQGRHLLAHELTHVVQQSAGLSLARHVQRQPKKKETYVTFQIHVTQQLDTEAYKIVAMKQFLGGTGTKIKWSNLRAVYDPKDSPFTLYVEISLLKGQRGGARDARGISTDASGDVAGAEGRAREFNAGKESDQKTALMNEIDRRFFDAIGDKTETKIKKGETGKEVLWNMIRDEVLFQHQYIANLPPQVKELIKFSTDGKTLTPADYDRLFAIAKKIEKLPPGQVADYASKVRGTTTDLSVFEASLDKYIAEMAERTKQREEREKTQTKLVGLEEIYKRYRTWKSLSKSGAMGAAVGMSGGPAGGGLGATLESVKVYNELERDLKLHNFLGIDDFVAWIKKFEASFEAESATIANDLLDKYAGKLFREQERYKNQTEVDAQYAAFSGFRASFAEFEANAAISNDYAAKVGKNRIPGQGHIHPKSTKEEAEEAYKKAVAAKANAKSQFEAVAAKHPIFNEEGMEDDKKIDKAELARADLNGFAALMQKRIAKRLGEIDTARSDIGDKPSLIYKMDKLLPHFYVQQGIQPGSIFDMIIQDKMREDAIMKLVKGLALAVVAIALSVVTFGAATPVLVAAGAGLAGAALGTYMAVEELKEYIEQKHLADVGFADDPSMVWVVLAVLGAGLDMAAAVKALRALGPAAQALNAGGSVSDFTKTVRALEKANEIEAKVARAAEKAAEGRKGLSNATAELGKVLGSRAYSFPGPLLDPDVYKAVVKMAYNMAKTGLYDVQKFIEELKLLRVKAGLGDLSPQELAKAKEAWAEGRALEAAEVAFEAAEKAKVGTYTTKIKWGIQQVDARPHGSVKGAYWGKRTPQTNARVDAYELKINPNNESVFLPHPDGGFVQFENMVGSTMAQDGKLIIQQRSIYHVADMPAFATEKVLAEARRQVAAATAAGGRVEWLISDARAMSQLDTLFKNESITITLRLVPE